MTILEDLLLDKINFEEIMTSHIHNFPENEYTDDFVLFDNDFDATEGASNYTSNYITPGFSSTQNVDVMSTPCINITAPSPALDLLPLDMYYTASPSMDTPMKNSDFLSPQPVPMDFHMTPLTSGYPTPMEHPVDFDVNHPQFFSPIMTNCYPTPFISPSDQTDFQEDPLTFFSPIEQPLNYLPYDQSDNIDLIASTPFMDDLPLFNDFSSSPNNHYPSLPSTSRDSLEAPSRRKQDRKHCCTFPGCQRRFSRMYNLKTHYETHFPNRVRPFPCNQCSKAFSRKHDLQRHVTSVHKGEKLHQCDRCGKGFARKDALTRHLTMPNCSSTHSS